ncbi:MAG: cob(I)yrinic acid a,c-diamide adenosyltransferase [Coriobacteriia bacterium]|nr:cob(I)yrinic acid a,c-diamide adenosyltransferase [Coriobacteriia bacterium]
METQGRVGRIQVYTGEGKGKTTAGVGQCVRAVGAGLRVLFVQFVKGGRRSSELDVMEGAGIAVVRPAHAWTGLLGAGPTEDDYRAVGEAWEVAAAAIASGDYDVVALDEINVALAHGLLELPPVLDALRSRLVHVEVVMTGRGAPAGLVEIADLVTEMVPCKHYYDAGVSARIGIEF